MRVFWSFTDLKCLYKTFVDKRLAKRFYERLLYACRIVASGAQLWTIALPSVNINQPMRDCSDTTCDLQFAGASPTEVLLLWHWQVHSSYISTRTNPARANWITADRVYARVSNHHHTRLEAQDPAFSIHHSKELFRFFAVL